MGNEQNFLSNQKVGKSINVTRNILYDNETLYVALWTCSHHHLDVKYLNKSR